MSQTRSPRPAGEFWEAFYAEREGVWSGRVNPLLERGVEGLTPGTALDLGCGEGGDAIWLAGRGWRVVGVDIAPTALARAREHADRAGVADRVDWQHHDLAVSLPEGEFDLVSAQFLHAPADVEADPVAVLRRAAERVAPRGVLLVGSHTLVPVWAARRQEQRHGHPVLLSTTALRERLRLDPGRWRVEVDQDVVRGMPGPDGEPGVRADSLLRLRRHG